MRRSSCCCAVSCLARFSLAIGDMFRPYSSKPRRERTMGELELPTPSSLLDRYNRVGFCFLCCTIDPGQYHLYLIYSAVLPVLPFVMDHRAMGVIFHFPAYRQSSHIPVPSTTTAGRIHSDENSRSQSRDLARPFEQIPFDKEGELPERLL